MGKKSVEVEPKIPAVEFAQRLQVHNLIDVGGMGYIREVYDTNLRRKMAMKVLRPEHRDNQRAADLFVEEAQITSQLDHPNIVPVHELGTDNEGNLYFTMKLVEGRTLINILERQDYRQRTEDDLFELLEIFLKVCDAVAFAHSRGVIHRDLKPENIMVGDFGEVYLMDWGISRLRARARPSQLDDEGTPLDPPASTHQTRDGRAVGTIHYMAPEQALGKNTELDERTDIFALGAILYEILTQKPPYFGGELRETLKRAQKAEITPPQELVPFALPVGLCRIAMKAMSRAPEDRYQSMAELKGEIRSFMQGGWRFPRRAYKAGADIVREGERGDEAYIIAEGRCAVYKLVDGEEKLLKELGPGEVFGEIAVFSSQPRSASVRAIGDVSVAIVTRKQFEEELGLGFWLKIFVRSLAERFRELDERATGLERRLAEERG